MSVNNYGAPYNNPYGYNNYPPPYAQAPPQGMYMPPLPKKTHYVRNGVLLGGSLAAGIGAISHTEKVINSSVLSKIAKFAKGNPIASTSFDLPLKESGNGKIIEVLASTEESIKKLATHLNESLGPGGLGIIKSDAINVAYDTGKQEYSLAKKLLTKDWTTLKAAGTLGAVGFLAGGVVGLILSWLKKDK